MAEQVANRGTVATAQPRHCQRELNSLNSTIHNEGKLLFPTWHEKVLYIHSVEEVRTYGVYFPDPGCLAVKFHTNTRIPVVA